MSVESSRAFLRIAYDSPELMQQLKAVTGTQEIVRLGLRYGYTFDVPELMEASSSFTGAPDGRGARRGRVLACRSAVPGPRDPRRRARLLHHEYRLDDLPGLKGVHRPAPPPQDQASVGRPRPASRATFREEDLRTTSMSPADPGFQAWHESMMKAHWRDPALGSGAPRRDFHLVNLDEHVDHPGYDRYLEAKHRMIRTLEKFFGSEVRFSGSLWYPPSSYRLWHTNETQPGWRMYVIDFDEPFADAGRHLVLPLHGPAHRGDRHAAGSARGWSVSSRPSRTPASCSGTASSTPRTRHRWSFGFVVPDDWMTAIARQV